MLPMQSQKGRILVTCKTMRWSYHLRELQTNKEPSHNLTFHVTLSPTGKQHQKMIDREEDDGASVSWLRQMKDNCETDGGRWDSSGNEINSAQIRESLQDDVEERASLYEMRWDSSGNEINSAQIKLVLGKNESLRASLYEKFKIKTRQQ
uniref:Uncharacterized protein n=1 Tax=Nelumbo nucifera TaxID=4432 RepID=A0A822YRD8_NELNU|nr:TPA_asm: hypothetical protein HUJ06_007405 [Nelumbo nucifera]